MIETDRRERRIGSSYVRSWEEGKKKDGTTDSTEKSGTNSCGPKRKRSKKEGGGAKERAAR